LLPTLFLLGCDAKQAENSAEQEITPTAQVQTVKLTYTDISETLTVYGAVLPLPNTLQTLSVPFASRIENVFVSTGQTVQRGDALLTLQPSEDAQLVVAQARQEFTAAEQELRLVQGRVALKLATQHEAVVSQLRVAQAKAVLQDLTTRGALQSHTLKAESAGVITALHVQQGQRLTAATPLLEWINQKEWGVTLGVEPENIAQLRLQQTVELQPINRAMKPILGRIILITQQIDPVTHLLNIIVKPTTNSGLLLNETVQGQISIAAKKTLVAPRSAVLPDAQDYKVFTIVNHHAVKHLVRLGLQNESQLEIIAPSLKAQDELVVLGNYELEDGMTVEIKP
jgi:RND family efflux transporter MFP subunit